jgi:D-amino-acid dehydrogenase
VVNQPDVVVIGAGAVGLSCAYHLARRGCSVTVVERDEIGSGASRANAGWVVPSLSGPVPSPASLKTAVKTFVRPDSPLKVRVDPCWQYVSFLARMLAASRRSVYEAGLQATARLASQAVAAFDELAADGVELERHREGMLLLFRHESGIHEQLDGLRAMERFGLPAAQALTAQEVRTLEPMVSPNLAGAIRCEPDEHVDPSTLVDGLARRCGELGVKILTGAHVDELLPREGHVKLSVDGEALAASAVVIAAGAGSRAVAALLGIDLPVRGGKGYGLDVAPTSMNGSLRHPMYLTERKVAVTPLTQGIRLSGTMEFGAEDATIDDRRIRGLHSAAGNYFEHWRASSSTAWSGLRPMTPDGLPIVGSLPTLPGVHVATGHAMLGITLAPVTGARVASIIVDGGEPADLAPFSPGRFAQLRRSPVMR